MTSTAEPAVPAPPRLHWILVLLMDLITRGFFEMVWLLIQTNWVRRVRGSSSAFWWSIAFVCLLPALFVLILLVAIVCVLFGKHIQDYMGLIVSLCVVSLIMVRTFAVFTLRLELAHEPVRLRTGYWKTILFGTAYLQYCLGRYSQKLMAVSKDASIADAEG